MASIQVLTPAKCLILASTAASDANIDELQALFRARPDIFNLELSLRLILTYLPESLETAAYSGLLTRLANVASVPEQASLASSKDTRDVDTTSVASVDEEAARQHIKRHVRLLLLHHDSIPSNAVDDLLTLFLVHRSYLVESRTGLLHLVVDLVEPFLDRNAYLRWWYATTISPLLCHNESAPDHSLSLEEFDQLHDEEAVRSLIVKGEKELDDAPSMYRHDLRKVVGPWTYGSTIRKRRKLAAQDAEAPLVDPADIEACWETTFQWMFETTKEGLQTVLDVMNGWDGPDDTDPAFPGHEINTEIMDETQRKRLRERYCSVAIACVYACEQDNRETFVNAHAILARIADLLDLQPPLELDAAADILLGASSIDEPIEALTREPLQRANLLDPDNKMTTHPSYEYEIVRFYTAAAYLLGEFGYKTTVARCARLPWLDATEQLDLYRRMVDTLLARSKQREIDWQQCRAALHAFLGLLPDEIGHWCPPRWGLLNRISVVQLDREILRALCAVPNFPLVKQIYLHDVKTHPRPLPLDVVEQVLVRQASEHYDSASNGNKTRGTMKKAADILTEFKSYFQSTESFKQLAALVTATHAMSYYSLILQPGIPFKPVGIRTSSDPVSMIQKILEQNAGSYTKLDDLVQIGRNLAITTSSGTGTDAERQDLAEHRVIEMVIRAALAEDDFETAYSYVTSRLGSRPTQVPDDDTSLSVTDDFVWRAAYEAGKHRTPSKSTSNPLRRPQQRMELLSSAMLLAPPSKLPDILAAWRRCEEEMLTILAQETAEEGGYGADATRSAMPGGFGGIDMVQPQRKEMGRGAAEEAPMGLFDVARGAAAALGRNTGALRGGGQAKRGGNAAASAGSRMSMLSDDGVDEHGNRVRKRDMVANAVTGGLVSGLGWVLGAQPASK